MKNKKEIRVKTREVLELLESGKSAAFIIKEYVDKKGVKRRTIERYIAFAKDLLSSRMKRRDAIIEANRADVIAEEAEKWLKSNLEIEARLCSIISGKVKFMRPVHTKDGIEMITSYPTCKEVINAMNILFKLRGAYKPGNDDNMMNGIIKVVVENEKEKESVERIINQPLPQ